MLIILVGLFSPNLKVSAADPTGTCITTSYTSGEPPITFSWPGKTEAECTAMKSGSITDPNRVEVAWTADSSQPGQPTMTSTPAGGTDPGKTAFQDELDDNSCGFVEGTIWPGCFIWISYGLFYVIPAFLLAVSAYFFNVLVSITLSGKLVSDSTFVSAAWTVVRDLSNIFFILILLYIAIKTILGLGGSEVKKMIGYVVLTALLINFSMFFTKIIIDTTNILALVFYNKINVETRVDGKPRPYESAAGEKDITGGLTKAFDSTRLLTADFFKQAKKIQNPPADKVPPGILISILIIAGVIMGYAAYCFLQVGIFFLSRLIELWVLIIFSPFAFMSYSVPILSKAEGIGWDEWWHRLLSVSFLAPVFMFFLYLIFKLIEANPFMGTLNSSDSMLETILFVIIPALVILIILKKATEKAKKSSGELGGAMIGLAKTVGGLAVGLAGGAALGGAALLGTRALGGLAARAASSKTLTEGAKKGGIAGIASRMALKTADYGSKASFDLRKVPGVGALAKAGGIDLEKSKIIGLGSKEGGYEARRAEKVKKRQERAKQLEVREDEGLKQNLNNVERDLQGLLMTNSHEIELIDKKIATARQNLNDANARFGAKSPQADDAGEILNDLKGQRSARKNGNTFTDSTGRLHDFSLNRVGGIAGGASINQLEDDIIPSARGAIEKENRARKWAYAESLQNRRGKLIAMSKAAALGFAGSKLGIGATLGLGALGHPIVGGAMVAGALAIPFAQEDKKANREAAHKIIMGVKLDSGEKH